MGNLQGSIDVASQGRSAQALLNRRHLSCDRRRLPDYSVTSRRRSASPVPVATTTRPATAPRTPSVEPAPCAIGAVPPPPACTPPVGMVPVSLALVVMGCTVGRWLNVRPSVLLLGDDEP